jgi:NAD-dependent SIR2 family protein deacetylase
MSVWSRKANPDGKVVELHGNARFLICPECGHTAEATSTDLIHMKRYKPRMCSACKKSNLRFKIMLYDDEKAELITPEDVWTRFEDDLGIADLVIWVGISFEQV